MKSMNTNNNTCSNWLGFSLSPCMSMEVPPDPHHQANHNGHHHQAQPPHAASAVSSAPPGSFFLAPHFSYGVPENGSLYSHLSVMPLKSDGSLCIMEALTRSHDQGMVTSLNPKLEDFLGTGPNDSIYYHQNTETESNRNHPLNLLHQSYFQPLQEEICSAVTNHEIYGEPVGTNEIPNLLNWGVGASHVNAMGYVDLQQPLSLSMSPVSQSSCVTAPQQVSPAAATESISKGKGAQKQPVHRKSIDTFGQRTSQYRGVTRYRLSTQGIGGRADMKRIFGTIVARRKVKHGKEGKVVYLGGYDMEEKAARAYDLAALKYWGPSTHINFSLEDYREELEEMKNMSRQEYVAHLRRKSSGFSRGASIYRGVTRHHQHGRWQARIGRVAGNKDLYLGTFSTQEEAAEAYDIAAIKFRGLNAVTNFGITKYDVERIIASSTLPSADLARRNKATIVDTDASSAPNKETKGVTSEWKMNLPEPLVQKSTVDVLDYQRATYAVNAHDIFGLEAVSSAQANEESPRMKQTQLSNASSLASSLSSSGEGSSDRSSLSVLYVKPLTKFTSPPLSSMVQMPVFSAWTDA